MRSIPSMPRLDGSSVSQVLEPGARDRLDVGLVSQRDDDVDIADELRVDRLRVLAGDVDTNLEQAFR